MKKHYFMFLAAAALAAGVATAEDGTWRNINYKAQNMAGVPGWSGCVAVVDFGVSEWFNTAGLLYQVIPDAPAGEYTLSANAFYRQEGAPETYALHKAGTEEIRAFLFANNNSQAIKSLFDEEGLTDETLFDADGNYIWGVAPNNMEESNAAFEAGKYLNTFKFTHNGGDLEVGIRNLGQYTEGADWTIFDNFKLTGPNGEVALVNGDFSVGTGNDEGWDAENVAGANKYRGLNHGGAVFSKTNASPYNIGQTLELPAGKYRFVVTGFMSYGHGNGTGKYVDMKGEWRWVEGETAYDRHVNNNEAESDHAYIYMNAGEKEAGVLDDNEINSWPNVVIEGEDYSVDGVQTKFMCLFDEKEFNPELGRYPDCEDENDYTDGEGNVYHKWYESGTERECAYVFVNSPELYRNVVEYELKEDGKLTFGVRKDTKTPLQYWQPSFNWRLERFEPGAGVANVSVDAEATVAPVYYNLNGVRVAEPANGLFIVKEGNKVSKKFFRN